MVYKDNQSKLPYLMKDIKHKHFKGLNQWFSASKLYISNEARKIFPNYTSLNINEKVGVSKTTAYPEQCFRRRRENQEDSVEVIHKLVFKGI